MGEFSGRRNINCKYLSEKAVSLACLRDNDKAEHLERENKEENRKLGQRDNGCYIMWNFEGHSKDFIFNKKRHFNRIFLITD